MFCRKCGTKATEGTKFCSKCGTKHIIDDSAQQQKPIEPISPITPEPSEPIPVPTVTLFEEPVTDTEIPERISDAIDLAIEGSQEKSMFCKNCGTKLKERAKFCQGCGYEITGKRNDKQTEETVFNTSESLADNFNAEFLPKENIANPELDIWARRKLAMFGKIISIFRFLVAAVWVGIVLLQLSEGVFWDDPFTVIWNIVCTVVTFILAITMITHSNAEYFNKKEFAQALWNNFGLAVMGIIWYGIQAVSMEIYILIPLIIMEVIILVISTIAVVRFKVSPFFKIQN